MLACLTVTIACVPGCAPAPAGVEGRVTIDGKPVNEAAIMFVPLDRGRAKTGAAIVDGQYVLPAQEGLLPGEYRVEVIDNPPLHPRRGTSSKGAPRRVLPPEFSHNSTLRFVVPPADGGTPPYQASFELKSKSPARAP